MQDKFTANSGSRTTSGTKKKKNKGSGSSGTGQQHLNNLLEKAMVQDKSTLKVTKNASKPPKTTSSKETPAGTINTEHKNTTNANEGGKKKSMTPLNIRVKVKPSKKSP